MSGSSFRSPLRGFAPAAAAEVPEPGLQDRVDVAARFGHSLSSFQVGSSRAPEPVVQRVRISFDGQDYETDDMNPRDLERLADRLRRAGRHDEALQAQPRRARSHTPPPRRDSFQRGGSAPREMERAREDRRDATREDPVLGHPQLTLLDSMSRQVYASNFPINSDAGPAATYGAPSEVYSIRHQRNPDEQRVASMPFNVLAPPSAEDFHGSHSGQHSAAGDSSRVNMTPVSSSGNVGNIGGFERQERQHRDDQSGASLSRGHYQHQQTTTEYDAPAMLPRLAAPATLSSLDQSSEVEQAMAASIRTQAQFIPARQVRAMSTPGVGTAVHTLGPSEIMGPRGGSQDRPRYPISHLRRPATRGRFERAGRPSGDPRQYRTDEDPNQQRTNALLHADLMRGLPEDDPHRRHYRERMEEAASERLQFPWRALEHVQQTAQQDFPAAPTHRSSERQAEDLRSEAEAFIARENLRSRRRERDDRGRGRDRRSPSPRDARDRSRSPARSRSRSRSRSR